MKWVTSPWTRRPASADRTARRQFQATGQPVSRTQASDAVTSRLPRYEAKCVQCRCFQWGSVPLRSGIKGQELPAANILIPLERQLIALQLCRWQFLYNETLQQTFRPLLSKLSKRWQIWAIYPHFEEVSGWWLVGEPVSTYFSISDDWGATRQNVSKLAAFRRGWVRLSQDFRGRGRPPANILIPLERQLIALQLCRWQFLYNETLQQTSRPLLSKLAWKTTNLGIWSSFSGS